MKKWLTITFILPALCVFGKQIDINDYKDCFFLHNNFLLICEPYRAIQLINKIDSTKSKLKKMILRVNLDVELEDLENQIIRLRDFVLNCKDSEEGSCVKEQQMFENSLKLIAEWKETYLKGD